MRNQWKTVLVVVALLFAACSTFEVGETPSIGSISNPEEAERAVYVIVKAADISMTALGTAYKEGHLDESARLYAEQSMAVLLRSAGYALAAVDLWRQNGSRSEFDANYLAARTKLVEISEIGGEQ